MAAEQSDVQLIGVVGAGSWAPGSRSPAARAGIQVVLQEPQSDALAHSRERTATSVGRAVRAGNLDDAGAAALQDRIAWTTELDAMAEVDLDVLYAICDSLYEEFKRPEDAPPPLLKRLVLSGHHGRKTGRGFYEYEVAAAAVTA